MCSAKQILTFLAIAAGIFLLIEGEIHPAWADSPSDYYSLHLEPAEIVYRDSSGDYLFETRSGFRHVHDYTDTKVLCGSETGPCTQTERQTAVRSLDKNIHRFRVYVPPGTTYLQVMLYLPKLGQIATVSRFEQPPTGEYAGKGYDDFPIDSDRGASLRQLAEDDYLTRNSGGHTTVIDQYFPDVPEGGGWLYIRVISFDASELLETRYTFRVQVAAFQDWFQGVNWEAFGETGGYVARRPSDPAGVVDDTPRPPGVSDTPVFGTGRGPKTGGMILDGDNNPMRFVFDILGGSTGGEADSVSTETAFLSLVASENDGPNLIRKTQDSSSMDFRHLRPGFKAVLPVEGPHARYAALIGREVVFQAERDLFGHVVFVRFLSGDRIRSYQTNPDAIAAGDVLECGVFMEAFQTEDVMVLDTDWIKQTNLSLFFGVAPADTIDGFQGVLYTFSDK